MKVHILMFPQKQRTEAESSHPGDPTPCCTAYPKPSLQCLGTSKDLANNKVVHDLSRALPQNVLGLDYSSSEDDNDGTSEQ